MEVDCESNFKALLRVEGDWGKGSGLNEGVVGKDWGAVNSVDGVEGVCGLEGVMVLGVVGCGEGFGDEKEKAEAVNSLNLRILSLH